MVTKCSLKEKALPTRKSRLVNSALQETSVLTLKILCCIVETVKIDLQHYIIDWYANDADFSNLSSRNMRIWWTYSFQILSADDMVKQATAGMI